MRNGRRLATVVIAAVALAVGIVSLWTATRAGCPPNGGPVAFAAVRVVDGTTVWSRAVGDAEGAAMIEGVIAGVGDSGVVAAVDGSTGELEWCHEVDGVRNAGEGPWPWIERVGDQFVTVRGGGDYVAFDPRSGEPVWTAERTDETHSGEIDAYEIAARTAGRTAGDVFAGDVARDIGRAADLRVEPARVSGQQIDVAVLDDDGNELWSARLPGYGADLHGDILVTTDQTGGTGQIPVGGVDHRISAYDAATGDVRWSTPTEPAGFTTWAIGDLIVTSGRTGVHALDRATGEIVWKAQIDNPAQVGRFSEPGGGTVVGAIGEPPELIVLTIEALEPDRD